MEPRLEGFVVGPLEATCRRTVRLAHMSDDFFHFKGNGLRGLLGRRFERAPAPRRTGCVAGVEAEVVQPGLRG